MNDAARHPLWMPGGVLAGPARRTRSRRDRFRQRVLAEHGRAVGGRHPHRRETVVAHRGLVSRDGVRQPAARRYRRLRSLAGLRVVGQTDAVRLGRERWYFRIRCAPDVTGTVARALARRPDTGWIHVVSGGTEINGVVETASPRDRDTLLFHKLPRTPRVLDVSAHQLLHTFFGGRGEHPALPAGLSPAQVAALAPEVPEGEPEPAGTFEPDAATGALFTELAADGRTEVSRLAAVTGWSESTVTRRLERLRRERVLFFDIDGDIRMSGLTAQARLWISVPPADLAATGTALAGHPEIAFVSAVTGSHNLVAALVCRDAADLYRYLSVDLAELGSVQRLETAPVLRTVKGAATVFDD